MVNVLENIKYIPILSLKPAEMSAIEELPEKDKNFLLPLISIKKWMNSKELIKSNDRVKKAIGERSWIADIDMEALQKIINGPRDKRQTDINQEFEALADSSNGYSNWFNFLKNNTKIIPTIQLSDTAELDKQLNQIITLERLITVRFQMSGFFSISQSDFNFTIQTMLSKSYRHGLLIILDYGDFNRSSLIEYQRFSKLINQLNQLFPVATFAISGTSFPYSFAGSYKGEIPIYERLIFNKVEQECHDVRLIYSDRASTRALSQGGANGAPPPRIDYPLKHDWRFIRKEFSDGLEKEFLYKMAASEVMSSDYWNQNLALWGTQMIEKTSMGDPYGIASPAKATAVRINLHLYQQLYYSFDLSTVDTEEDWVD